MDLNALLNIFNTLPAGVQAVCTAAAGELEEKNFRQAVRREPPGWNETLYLAVAKLEAHRRRRTLLELLERSPVQSALACLEATAEEDRWLTLLVQFLARYYWEGEKYR